MSPCFTLHYIQCLRLSEASSFRRKKLNMRNKLVMSRLVQINQPCSFFLFFFFFYLGCLSRTFSNHRTAGEGGGLFFNSSLPLPPASRTLRHQPGDCCRELTSAHSYQPDSNRELLVSQRKSLTTKLCALQRIALNFF